MPFHALVVEDDPAAQCIYQHILTSLGYTVATAGSGAQAIETLTAHAFHLVILDLLLPVVGGREVLRFVYQANHLRATRVIVVSAHRDLADSTPLRRNDVFLVKPVPTSTLREFARQAQSAETFAHGPA